jgi:hypothetical protein
MVDQGNRTVEQYHQGRGRRRPTDSTYAAVTSSVTTWFLPSAFAR